MILKWLTLIESRLLVGYEIALGWSKAGGFMVVYESMRLCVEGQ